METLEGSGKLEAGRTSATFLAQIAFDVAALHLHTA